MFIKKYFFYFSLFVFSFISVSCKLLKKGGDDGKKENLTVDENSKLFEFQEVPGSNGKMRNGQGQGRDLFPDEIEKLTKMTEDIDKLREDNIKLKQGFKQLESDKKGEITDEDISKYRRQKYRRWNAEYNKKKKIEKYSKKISLDRQDKKTKKRMKKNWRKTKRIKNGKNPTPLYLRIFGVRW